jgi:hypothetical protein
MLHILGGLSFSCLSKDSSITASQGSGAIAAMVVVLVVEYFLL